MNKYITYSKMGLMGRIGNQLFEVASLYGMAKRYNREMFLPSWGYGEFFEYTMPIGEKVAFDTEIHESTFHHGWEYWDGEAGKRENEKIINVGGWLQSPKYWAGLEADIKNMFAFKHEFFVRIRERYKEIFNNNKESIAISMRIGQDYKDNGNYEILPISYYISALYEKFPQWRNYNIVIFCDDMQYAALNFQGEGIYFAPSHPMEQLCLGSMCDHFILSNSTFSWWMAYLGEKQGSKVVYPSKYYKADLVKSCDTKDFWPTNWEKWGYNNKLIARDVTFTIPITMDSLHRRQNFDLCIAYLRKHFDTNILVGEQGERHCEEGYYGYIHFPYKDFHRTKMLNDMANESNTKIIVNQDTDVFTPIFQICQAIDAIRGGVDMAFPYDGRMARVPREGNVELLRRELDAGYFKGDYKGTRGIDPPSVGGSIFWNKESFVFGGMENERMINYGPEDVERVYRMKTLGYKVFRVKGATFHLDHWVGPNSGGKGNPHYGNNYDELNRIQAMDNEQLLSEIAGWSWVNQYMGAYYEDINEGSIESAKAIFSTLRDNVWGFQNLKSVIDVGCGVGSWKLGIGEQYEYYGVDLKVPKHRLQFPEANYREYDLNSTENFPFDAKYDIAICTEVAEHLKPESAERLVELLCSLSDNILFSAAIPHQGGNNHFNEQWQSYWAKLFAKHGAIDATQMMEWLEDEPVEPWYRQNIVLYKKGTGIKSVVKDYVLPEMYTNIIGSLTDWK